MTFVEKAGLAALKLLDPETAQHLALKSLQWGLAPLPRSKRRPKLETEIAGMELPNPLGLAAGFDKNAVALAPLTRAGFGFVEVGATTPRPQPGNPKPRLFRLKEDAAVINRFGFNNDGMEAMAEALSGAPKGPIIGLNLGANKDSEDRTNDYCAVLETCGPHLDFATINVSSPNTEGLRSLQGADALPALLARVVETNAGLPRPIKLFLKIAPDLPDTDLPAVGEAAIEHGLDAIIATNTTLARDGLKSRNKAEAGGLSGRPLFARSTEVLRLLYKATEGRIPLIGVGGIDSAETAMAKIRAGASALQLYSALSIHGLSLLTDILDGMEKAVEREGADEIAALVGVDA